MPGPESAAPTPPPATVISPLTETLPAPPLGAGRAPRRAVRRARLAGDEGIWFFIAGDLCLFSVIFALFMTGRIHTPALFEHSRLSLHLGLGVFNTLVLITSSYFMARAVVANRHGARADVVRNLGLALGIGSIFAIVKAFEYGALFSSGISPVTNNFFMYYFVLTGLHLMHYLGGIAAITVTIVRARKVTPLDDDTRWIESVAVYWHMVDLIWIFLFPMMYLLRVG
jgi:nitric oxide reductase NorE protein